MAAAPLLLGLGTLLAALVARNRKAAGGTPAGGTPAPSTFNVGGGLPAGSMTSVTPPPPAMSSAPAGSLPPPPAGGGGLAPPDLVFGMSPPKLLGSFFDTAPTASGVRNPEDYTDNYVKNNMYGDW